MFYSTKLSSHNGVPMGQFIHQKPASQYAQFPKSFLTQDKVFSQDNHEQCINWGAQVGEQFIGSTLAKQSLPFDERNRSMMIVCAISDLCYKTYLEKPSQWTQETIKKVCLKDLPQEILADEGSIAGVNSILAVFFLWMGKIYNLENAKELYQTMLDIKPALDKVGEQYQQKRTMQAKKSEVNHSIDGLLDFVWDEQVDLETEEELSYYQGYFPDFDLFRVLECGKDAYPLLYRLIQHAMDHHEDIDMQYTGHFCALFLLAEMKDKGTFPLVMELARLPWQSLEMLLGDILTEELHQIMASVFNGDLNALLELIENSSYYMWSRNAGLQTLMVLTNNKKLERSWLIDYLSQLMMNASIKNDPMMMAFIVNIACDLYPEELMEQIRQAYKLNLVDEHYIDLNEVEDVLSLGKDEALSSGLNKYHTLDDAISSLKDYYKAFGNSSTIDTPDDLESPFHQAAMKIGRNEPCLCGSGKKYKKCCLQ